MRFSIGLTRLQAMESNDSVALLKLVSPERRNGGVSTFCQCRPGHINLAIPCRRNWVLWRKNTNQSSANIQYLEKIPANHRLVATQMSAGIIVTASETTQYSEVIIT